MTQGSINYKSMYKICHHYMDLSYTIHKLYSTLCAHLPGEWSKQLVC